MKGIGRRGILFIIVGIIVAALGIFFVGNLLEGVLSEPEIFPTPVPLTEQVVITSRGVPSGSLLTTDDLTLANIPIELVPLSRITDINTVAGTITTIPLVAGEMVLPHHVIDQTNVVDRNLAFTLEDDQVLMAFPILDLMSSINILKRGDVVDILVSISEEVASDTITLTGEEQTQTELFTFDALQRLTITAVIIDYVSGSQPTPVTLPTPGAEATPAPPPEPSRGQTRPVALMLALSPQDALVLKHLKDTGAIFDLVLRSPTSTLYFETVPVTSDYINQKFGLQTIP
ncbi:MAG: SAF domain-containing protein [Chloroflexota bacterium]|nr:SAF domain-containing protein [Chloroflexota bacterium]